MTDDAVAIAAIVMLGVLLSIVAWQLLAIARTAVARGRDGHAERLEQRLAALEDLHDAGRGTDHQEAGQR